MNSLLSADSTDPIQFNLSLENSSREVLAASEWEVSWVTADSEIPNAGMVVSVSQPQLTGTFVNRHMTYLVETQPSGWAVRRRFSDFYWLRTMLLERYPGLLVPSLPAKDLVGKAAGKTAAGFQSEFIRTRMRLLGIFLDQVVQVPFLRTDASLLAFLSAQSDAEWTTQKQISAGTTVLTDESPGCSRWKEEISKADLPVNVDRILAEMTQRLVPLGQTVQECANSSKELLDACKDYCMRMREMNTTFQSLANMESALQQLGSFRGDASNQPGGITATTDMMLIGSEVFSNWAQVEEFRPTILNSVLYSALTYEFQQIQALQEMIESRNQAMRELVNTEKVLKRHQEQLDLMEKGNPMKSVNTASILNAFTSRGTLEADIAQDFTKIQIAQKKIDMISRALFFSEIERFNKTRQKMLSELMKQLAGSEFQYARRLAQIWQTAMEAMNFDLQVCLDSAKHLIALSSTVSNLDETAAV